MATRTPESMKDALAGKAASLMDEIMYGSRTWPNLHKIGLPTRHDQAAAVTAHIRAWHEADADPDFEFEIVWETVTRPGSRWTLPTHIRADFDQARALLVGRARAREQRIRTRSAALHETFPDADLGRAAWTLLCATAPETEFDFICHAARWIADHDPEPCTPRQLPIPGMVNPRWLVTYRSVIAALSGNDFTVTRMITERPRQTHLAYVDPGHRARGGRHFDCLTEGDPGFALPYPPRAVLVVENFDCFTAFPEYPGLIVVCGNGTNGASKLTCLHEHIVGARILYWGDMDRSGFTSLHDVRASGFSVCSVGMDYATYMVHRHLAVPDGTDGIDIEDMDLTGDERRAAEAMSEPGQGAGPVRIEQEQIGFDYIRDWIGDL